MQCTVGLDDTDSLLGHCTTHLGFRAVGELLDRGCTFGKYPRLIRLNPNIPFKTRGNAAVCLEFETDDPEGAFGVVETILHRLSDVENGANSGLVFMAGSFEPDFFRGLYLSAVSGLVSYRRVLSLLAERKVRHVTVGNGMGVVGAVASLGFSETDDHTYEIIGYRRQAACGTKREIKDEPVVEMERRTFPHTFNSYDHRSRRVLVTPHGPDPVFLGIRADSPGVALSALRMLGPEEELAGHMIYLSNQCTDAHLTSRLTLPMKAYASGWLDGSVEALERGEGGHLYIDLNAAGSVVRCAIYRPAADLQRAAGMLGRGDAVRVFGGVRRATSRHPSILNVEKVEVLSLDPGQRSVNPTCAACGRIAKSEGTGKGFQCRRCGAKFSEGARRTEDRTRSLVPGIYLPSSGSQRHLTKPLIRYGRELYEALPLIEGWFHPATSEASSAPAKSPRSGHRSPLSPRTP
ncbi:MAG: tRNA(Ile)(2)-agmatinylcytidine synthase [Thaumarchaeota archaeon]|nr:tRNA(Ile)(2)-agmatinylcytidine synthase [Nitrososphaerota archaeon]